ncbi:hypothetical protein PM10SUCC1_32670 [Propionigenium maris DSM 9537]|uniref:Uncharacterized protein n=1 Tax=Propionigenium maris DSM 9537 TaxID=1123000 RepID=A0A9W6LPH2_9FUSO|nr:hypothetical protein [Propionigenium maris]GLI57753.1 hypothetical protein PM10SUCC1_32670 [Propionigenium maris DSM 9537]
MRSTTDFGNWNNLWEEVENGKLDQEDIQSENQVHESIEEVQSDAAAFLLGRC